MVRSIYHITAYSPLLNTVYTVYLLKTPRGYSVRWGDLDSEVLSYKQATALFKASVEGLFNAKEG